MPEFQTKRMQRLAPEFWDTLAAVYRVSYQRVSDRGHMYPYLVGATSMENAMHQAAFHAVGQKGDIGAGRFTVALLQIDNRNGTSSPFDRAAQ